MQETYELNVQVNIDRGAAEMLDTQTAQTLFSITVETLNNARKHSKANIVTVDLRRQDEMIILEIVDDGVGFDVDQALAEAAEREGHLGLINLQERAALVEGALAIHSRPGAGTRTVVAIPQKLVRFRKQEQDNRAAQESESRVMVRTLD
jgi:signal transduction histidine kinase